MTAPATCPTCGEPTFEVRAGAQVFHVATKRLACGPPPPVAAYDHGWDDQAALDRELAKAEAEDDLAELALALWLAKAEPIEGKPIGGKVAVWHLPNGDPGLGLTWCGLRLKGITVRGQAARDLLSGGEGRLCPTCQANQATNTQRAWRAR